jgi:hypothetical protein
MLARCEGNKPKSCERRVSARTGTNKGCEKHVHTYFRGVFQGSGHSSDLSPYQKKGYLDEQLQRHKHEGAKGAVYAQTSANKECEHTYKR